VSNNFVGRAGGTGRVAVVTGGSSGIGLAVTRRLVEAGYAVEIWARREDVGRAAAARLGSAVNFRRCDVADATSVRAAAEGLPERLDLLVNAAGILQRGPLGADTAAQVDVLLKGTILVTGALAPRLAGGVIVNLGSVAGREPFPGLAAYGAAKAGVAHFTRAAARELLASRVRVLCVSPGLVETNLQPAAELALLRQTTPHRRLQSPDEVAAFIVALAGDAYPSLTGAVIDLDDGLSLYTGSAEPPRAAPARPAPATDAVDPGVAAVLASVFGIPAASVHPALGPEQVERWDSLGHLRLVSAIEQAFAVLLNADDAMDLVNAGAVARVVASKRAAARR
jgi:NAD(P)-dependent dehydrogenase (short-subunit alcohol dehydrogenase family)/acyl carrier protein